MYRVLIAAVLAAALLVVAPMAAAHDYDNNWESGFHLNGFDGAVNDIVDYDGCKIFAGLFDHVGPLAVNCIVGWDPVTESYFPLGSGLERNARDMAVFEGDLIVSGWFTTAGGVPAPNIARWNGSAWSGFGDELPLTQAPLAVYDGQLHAGPYRWTGSVWEDFLQTDADITCLQVWDGKLIIGGDFTEILGVAASSICSWDGAVIEPLGAGFARSVQKLHAWGGDLIACRDFGADDFDGYEHIQSWDGAAWTSLNFVTPAYAESFTGALDTYQGDLLVAVENTWFFWEETMIARYDGSQWSTFIELPHSGQGRTFHADGDDLYLGGRFSGAGDVASSNAVRFDGLQLLPMVDDGLGLNGWADALCLHDGNLVVGGGFIHAGTVPSAASALWNGSAWSAMGGLVLEGDEQDLPPGSTFFDIETDGTVLAGNLLFFSGDVIEQEVCHWDGDNAYWVSAAWGHQDLAVLDGMTYTIDTQSGLGVVSLVGDTWVSVPGGPFDGWTYCLDTWNGLLVVGGDFNQVGAVNANHVAIWNGYYWSALGPGLPGIVESFGEFDGALVASYRFEDMYRVACWTGTQWQDLPGDFGNDIHCFEQYGGHLYAGGSFRDLDGQPAMHLAWWNGHHWSPYGSGTDGNITDLEVFDGKLYVAGGFSEVGNVISSYFACLPAPLPDGAPVDPEIAGPTVLRLAPNVPNPFNPATTFTFSLPTDDQVRLEVYDLRGRLVGEIAHGHYEAGEHTARWNGRDLEGRDLPSGVYFARLGGATGVQTRKVTLAR